MTTQPAPDPIAILLEEHVQAEQGFVVFEEALNAAAHATDPTPLLDAARTLLVFLDSALEVHIRKEEEPLFPRLKAKLPVDDRYIEELIAEHDQIRIRREEIRAEIEELLSGDDHDEMRNERESLRAAVATAERAGPAADLSAIRATGRVLLRTLRVHFQSEEEMAFPMATDLLSPEELAAAGWEMLAIDDEGATMSNQPYNARPSETQQANVAARLDLAAEIDSLRRDAAYQNGDRSAATLIKQPDLRVVLTAMKAGARLAQHNAPGGITIYALQGRLRVALADGPVELGPGDLISLAQNVSHDVAAIEESAFLLTIAWPQ